MFVSKLSNAQLTHFNKDLLGLGHLFFEVLNFYLKISEN